MTPALLDAKAVAAFGKKLLNEVTSNLRSAPGVAVMPPKADLRRATAMLKIGLKEMAGQSGPFTARDPAVSNLQSAMDAYTKGLPVDPTATGKPKPTKPTKRAFDKFSRNDVPRWVAYCGVAKGLALFKKKHAFVSPADQPFKIADNARLVFFGDWGSGLPGAIKVALVARKKLEEAHRQGREAHAIHLGDVYYSGWTSEYRERALLRWPVLPEESKKFGSWTVNANHDMFSGGYGFFDTLLQDPRFFRQKGSSEFVLQNSFWTFVGLDTAYVENTLQPARAAWALKNLNAGERGRVLLSHHYYFSDFEKSPLAVPPAFRKSLKKKPIDAWFWGHEHRAAIYHPRDGVRFPYCVGHGGIPERPTPSWKKLPKGCRMEFNTESGEKNGPWKRFGLAMVDCSPVKLTVSFFDEDGRLEHKEEVQRQ